MNKGMIPGPDPDLMNHLGALAVEEFFSISGYVLGHEDDGTSRQWPVERNIDTLPYFPAFERLGEHASECEHCYMDGTGPTTCPEALALENLTRADMNEQFMRSIFN